MSRAALFGYAGDAADFSGDDDADVDVDEEEATTADYTVLPAALRQPAKVHRSFAGKLDAGALWSVAVSDLAPKDVEAHVAALTCSPKQRGGSAYGQPKSFSIGYVSGDRLHMPPAYARAAFPDAEVDASALVTGELMRPEAVFVGKLWQAYPPQEVAARTYAQWVASHPTCPAAMLSLPCGHGKSVVCLSIAACQVRRVTLILVHMTNLVDQWIAEAKRYIPGARVGYITADGARVEGVDIIVASIHTLRSHLDKADPPAYLSTLLRRVGFVILDEAHHGVANTFQRVMAAMPAARRMAVTATPRRSDGLFQELQWIFGPVVFRSFRRRGDCQVVMLQWKNPELKERLGWGPRGTRPVRADLMEDDALADAARTDAITQLVCYLVSVQKRRVLVVTPRKAYVEELAVQLRADMPATVAPRTVRLFVPEKPPTLRRRRGESEADAAARKEATLWEWQDSGPHGEEQEFVAPVVGAVSAGMPLLARLQQYEGWAVVATTDIMKEGVSVNAWDTLVDLDNVSDPEQVVGRIQRAGEKKVPLVVDVWSPVSIWMGLKQRRVNFYRQEQFTVKTMETDAATWSVDEEFWGKYDRVATTVL